MSTSTIEINAEGRRIGEGHPRCRYSNRAVFVMQRLVDAGLSFSAVARLLEVPYSTVRSVANGRTRCQTPAAWKDA